jgi:hypothetical protein
MNTRPNLIGCEPTISMTKRITPTDMAVGRLLGCEPAAKPALDPGNPLHRALLRLETCTRGGG